MCKSNIDNFSDCTCSVVVVCSLHHLVLFFKVGLPRVMQADELRSLSGVHAFFQFPLLTLKSETRRV